MMYGCDECGCVRKDISKERCHCECHEEFRKAKSIKKKGS